MFIAIQYVLSKRFKLNFQGLLYFCVPFCDFLGEFSALYWMFIPTFRKNARLTCECDWEGTEP